MDRSVWVRVQNGLQRGDRGVCRRKGQEDGEYIPDLINKKTEHPLDSDAPFMMTFPSKFRTYILYFMRAEKSRNYGDFARFMYSIKILNLGRDYGNKEKDNTVKKRGCPRHRRIP